MNGIMMRGISPSKESPISGITLGWSKVSMRMTSFSSLSLWSIDNRAIDSQSKCEISNVWVLCWITCVFPYKIRVKVFSHLKKFYPCQSLLRPSLWFHLFWGIHDTLIPTLLWREQRVCKIMHLRLAPSLTLSNNSAQFQLAVGE